MASIFPILNKILSKFDKSKFQNHSDLIVNIFYLFTIFQKYSIYEPSITDCQTYQLLSNIILILYLLFNWYTNATLILNYYINQSLFRLVQFLKELPFFNWICNHNSLELKTWNWISLYFDCIFKILALVLLKFQRMILECYVATFISNFMYFRKYHVCLSESNICICCFVFFFLLFLLLKTFLDISLLVKLLKISTFLPKSTMKQCPSVVMIHEHLDFRFFKILVEIKPKFKRLLKLSFEKWRFLRNL